MNAVTGLFHEIFMRHRRWEDAKVKCIKEYNRNNISSFFVGCKQFLQKVYDAIYKINEENSISLIIE